MKLKIFAFITVVAISVSGPANAGYISYETGNSLLKNCESESNYELGICLGFVIGVAEAANNIVGLYQITPTYCISTEVTQGQLRKVFINYANDNPQDLHYGASDLILNAFAKAFPCGQGN